MRTMICNGCVAATLIGLMMLCVCESKTMALVAFSLIFVGICVGMISASITPYYEEEKKEKMLKNIRELDERDIKAGRFDYILEEKDK